jgi:hypothetical protein
VRLAVSQAIHDISHLISSAASSVSAHQCYSLRATRRAGGTSKNLYITLRHPPCSHPITPPFHRSRPPTMHHLFTCLGRKGKWQKNSSLPNSASQFPPKGECEKEDSENVEAIDTPTCCYFGLCSGDVSRLNSTTQSNNEDISTCKDAITGRYLLPFVTDQFPLPSNWILTLFF